ncbi:afadin isoform X9, partial [Sigmodon hispidus]
MSAGGRDEERRKLADIIHHWNANRLDLFEISQPTETPTYVTETLHLVAHLCPHNPPAFSLMASGTRISAPSE